MHHERQPTTSVVRRVATWLGVMTVATAALTVVSASPSLAAVVPTNALATASVGYGFFNADTEVLSIHDSHADGEGVGIIYYRYDLAKTGPYYAWNREGNGTTTYLYLTMPDLAGIKLYACPEKGGIIDATRCGARAFGYAGGGVI
ncbi:hypothetical protein AB0F59_12535 [Micromonospora lupini]|uniref:hypothetical protein n=1 Tax=Micromonospora lupini TaxID=285679 RepID=UPI0033E2BA26